MKIDPINLIIRKNLSHKVIFFFVSGNEMTLMLKIKDFLIKQYNKDGGYSVENIKDLKSRGEDIGLFENKKMFIISDISGLNEDFLKKESGKDSIYIFFSENSPKNKQIKNIFTKRNDCYLIDCYELTKDSKVLILNEFIRVENINIDSKVYWFLLEKLDNKYMFLEKELEKLKQIKKTVISEELISNVIVKNSSGAEKIFFEILSSNNKLVKLYNERILGDIEALSLFYVSKQFCLLIINNNNEIEFNKNIPRYLFREKNYLIEIYKKFTDQKKKRLLNLIYKTETSLRKQSGLSMPIGLRFILNLRKIATS